MIRLDGAHLEGGGQIIRTAVGLSALTGRECKIKNIRAGRSNPGLRHQHLKSVEACGWICNAQIEGMHIGSEELTFIPGELAFQDLEFDIGTAGSITLLMQALLIPVSQAKSTVSIRLKGGTHVAWSPTMDYFNYIFCPYLKRIGISVESEVLRYGFYPKGGGEIHITISASDHILPLNLIKRSGIPNISACSVATENLSPARVAERQLEGAKEMLSIQKETASYVSALSTGTALLLYAEFDNCILGASQLGRQGVPAEDIGSKTARDLHQLLSTPTTVDQHMADQLLPFLSMASGNSAILAPEITGHVRTNMWVIQQFLDVEFSIDQQEEGAVIHCQPHK
jgi:RNA 3'-terminal phosphate cyclase (ATP)/RNA 3'-terminal phosphate cyclase (GTP)